MKDKNAFQLQLLVFALVSSAITNMYITQPVLPVLQDEFGVDLVLASFSVSIVILGISLSNLPFGILADKIAIHPIILVGGCMVSAGGLLCSLTHNYWIFLGSRCIQGLFIPCLTTCLAAYLAKTLPVERLSVVMGSYVSATVLGGLSGRLLGGWIHPPLHWRYAFVSAAILTLFTTGLAVYKLPRHEISTPFTKRANGFWQFLRRLDIVAIYCCAMGSFALFSSIFNFLPYRLSAAPFLFSTEKTTLIYLVYIVGIFIGPLAGKISNRIGGGRTLLLGSAALGMALGLLLLSFLPAIIFGLFTACGGFFAIHAAAVGLLNRKLSSGQGRANALYVMFYYLGGWLGITASGFVLKHGGWNNLILTLLLLLVFPIGTGIREHLWEKTARTTLQQESQP